LFDKEKTPEESRRVADVILRGRRFRRLGSCSNTPPQVVKTMRDATQSMGETTLLDEAKKGKLEVEYVPGEELSNLPRRCLVSRRGWWYGKKASWQK